MAGDWMRIRLDLYEDSSILTMAEELDLDPLYVVGACVRIWSWLQRNCNDGNALHVTLVTIDRVTCTKKVAFAMQKVGWLSEGKTPDGTPFVRVENWDKWMSQSAKTRMDTALRVRRHREKRASMEEKHVTRYSNDSVTVKTLPEKRREEKNKERPPYIPPNGGNEQNHNSIALDGNGEQPEAPEPAQASRSGRRKMARSAARNGYPPEFELFWSAYPHRGVPIGKVKAHESWAKLSSDERAQLLRAAENLALTKTAREGFAKDPERFIKREEWRDYVELSESQIVELNDPRSADERVKAIEREHRNRERDELLIQASDSPDARELRKSRGLPESLSEFRPTLKRV